MLFLISFNTFNRKADQTTLQCLIPTFEYSKDKIITSERKISLLETKHYFCFVLSYIFFLIKKIMWFKICR